MVAGVAWTEATCGTLADGAAWRWAPEGTSTSSPTNRPAKAVSGKSFHNPYAPGGRSHQGHEDVHREVEEMSSRRDHQGARGSVGGWINV